MVADTMYAAADRVVPGKVFEFELKTVGGLHRGDRVVRTKLNEWDACTRCDEFDTCFRLSLGTLTVEGVVAQR
jgi:hypothetical protein